MTDSTRATVVDDGLDKNQSARPSSLLPVHKLTEPDRHYDLQLLRSLEIVNRLTCSALGPLPAGGIPPEPSRKPNLIDQLSLGDGCSGVAKESDTMKINHLAMTAAVALASGCNLSSANWQRHGASRVEDGKLKIPFYDHGFDAKCYDTLRCRVAYDNAYIVNDGGPSGPFTKRDRDNLGGHWTIPDFPSLVQVSWTSKDGEDHHAEIDLGEIFHSHLIRYPDDLDVNDVDLIPYSGTPDIILVVEDRSIHVYMMAWIALLNPRYPGREHSNFRHDPVVAYSQKF